MNRYRFIAEERHHYPVRQLCAVLKVSVSGFYDWLKQKPGPRAQANIALAGRIRQVHERSRQTYGYLRVHAELCASGERVGKHRVARLMRQMGLQTKGRRRFRVTTQRDDQHRRTPNLLRGDFTALQRNDKWFAYLHRDPRRLAVSGRPPGCFLKTDCGVLNGRTIDQNAGL